MSDMLGSAWTGLDVKKVPIAQALVKPTGLDQDLALSKATDAMKLSLRVWAASSGPGLQLKDLPL